MYVLCFQTNLFFVIEHFNITPLYLFRRYYVICCVFGCVRIIGMCTYLRVLPKSQYRNTPYLRIGNTYFIQLLLRTNHRFFSDHSMYLTFFNVYHKSVVITCDNYFFVYHNNNNNNMLCHVYRNVMRTLIMTLHYLNLWLYLL